MSRIREAAKQETRDALVAAAATEMAEKGIDGASLDAICARAGFTRGAFYVHFSDRDELVAAVVDRHLKAFFDQVIAGNDAPEDLERTIAQFVAAVVANAPVVRGRKAWQFHHTLAACARSPVLRERYVSLQREAIARVAGAARAGQRSGQTRADVPAETIAELLVLLTMGVDAALDVGVPFDLAGGARALKALLGPSDAGGRARERARMRRR
ncbi:MAG: TetR/AcrR family transcriptional regulator [Polyangiaceae bacterium]|jgi:AcrR family transcriptional regulator